MSGWEWTFNAATAVSIVATAVMVVQWLKKGFEWLAAHAPEHSWSQWLWNRIGHGWGPVVLTALVSVTAILPDLVVDGKLTMPEMLEILKAIGIFGGSNILYWLTRLFAFTKNG